MSVRTRSSSKSGWSWDRRRASARPTTKGSRLTESDIQAYVDQLNARSLALFGPNVKFVWDPADLATIVDNSLLGGSRTRSIDQFVQNISSQNWEVDHLNIYFTGDVQPSENGGDSAAITLDPKDVQPLDTPPFTLVNDGGYQLGNGFVSPPDVQIAKHILEHEMTHYLARFKNQTYNGRTYDSTEHIAPGANNILVPVTPPPFPLVIPGDYDEVGTENKEIFDRIHAGLWNDV